MLSNHARAVLRCSLVAIVPGFLLLPQLAAGAPFTAGDLVVVRAAGGPNGDGTAALGGSGLAAAVFLDEYTTGGAFVQSVAMPMTQATSGNRALTLSGTQNIEGALTLSGDGRYLLLAGYNQTANTVNTSNSMSTAVERVIGRVDWATGTIDTTTALTDAMSAVSVRSAYSTNGTDLWITGNGGGNVTINSATVGTGGVRYTTLGSTTSTQLNTAGLTSNNRVLNGFAGQLYVSNQSTSSPAAPNRGVDTVGASGSGFPIVTGQTVTSLTGFPSVAAETPDDYVFFNPTTLYIADERAFTVSTGTTQAGGIQKWVFNSTTAAWELQYTLPVNGTAGGAHGLAATTDGSGDAVLFATTFEPGGNADRLISITDTGSGSLPQTLQTSATNTAFRGVELIPAAVVPEPGSLGLLMVIVPLAARRRATK
jgi:hypothetical protein